MDNYRRGRNAEYYVMGILASHGYRCARMAGSHTPADILAGNGKTLLAVQVKSGSSRFTDKDAYRLKEWAAAFKAEPVLATNSSGKWLLKWLNHTKS